VCKQITVDDTFALLIVIGRDIYPPKDSWVGVGLAPRVKKGAVISGGSGHPVYK